MVNPIDFGGHSSNMKVTMGIIEKCECTGMLRFELFSDWEEIFANGNFQLFSMILKISVGHFLSFYTDFDGPFSKLMGLWRMAPCLPNHWLLYFCLGLTISKN